MKHLFAFLILGALVYLLEGVAFQLNIFRPHERLDVSSDDVQQLKDGYYTFNKRLPNEEELNLLLEAYVSDEILFREALRLKVHLTDDIVRQRLIKNMKFLNEAIESDELAFDQAISINLHRHDLVVRRRLVERMEKVIHYRDLREPDSKILTTYFETNKYRYSNRSRYKLFHQFIENKSLGNEEVSQFTKQWYSGQILPSQIDELSSYSLIPSNADVSQKQIIKLFGEELFSEINKLQIGQAYVKASPSGYHFIKLIDKQDEVPFQYESIKNRLRMDYLTEQGKAVVQNEIDYLKQFYQLEIASL